MTFSKLDFYKVYNLISFKTWLHPWNHPGKVIKIINVSSPPKVSSFPFIIFLSHPCSGLPAPPRQPSICFHSCLFIQSTVIDIWVVDSFGLLQIKMLWTFTCQCLYGHMIYFLSSFDRHLFKLWWNCQTILWF